MEDYVEEFINFLIVERNLAQNTIEAYATDLARYSKFLLSRQIYHPKNIDLSDIVVYLTGLQKEGLSSLSIARNLSAIRMFHRFLLSEGITETDPSENIDSPKLARKLPIVLDQFEIERIISQPDITTPLGVRDRALLETAYATGVRVSELISLKTIDLMLEDQHLRVYCKRMIVLIVPL